MPRHLGRDFLGPQCRKWVQETGSRFVFRKSAQKTGKRNSVPELGTEFRKWAPVAGNRNLTKIMKIRITFINSEVALSQVFLRLAYQQDEGYRSRAVRSSLAMLLEAGQLPQWFTSMPQAQGLLPRSLTVRVHLSSSDPSHQWVMNRLSSITDSNRAAWIKTLMAKSLGLVTDPSISAVLQPSTALAAYPSAPSPAVIPSPPSSDSASGTEFPTAAPAEETTRKQAHKNALKAFDMMLWSSTKK